MINTRDPWSTHKPAAYGLDTSAVPRRGTAAAPIPGLSRAALPGDDGLFGSPIWHPDSPMFWFGVLAATAFGLAYASTSVRIGPVRASVSAGDEKK